MKKVLALIIGLAMLLSMAACNKKVEVPSKKDAKAAVEEEYDMKFKLDSEDISKDEKEAEWVFVSKDGTLEVTVTWNAKNPKEFEFDDKELEPVSTETDETEPTETETTETTTEATTTTTSATTSASSSADSSATGTTSLPNVEGGIIRFDDMCFYVNGKKYVLGKTTLQEMIDDGVPFDEDDLGDANNNLKANYQSNGFDIRIEQYYSATIYVLNYSDEGKPMSECVVNEIRFHPKDPQDIVTFDFPQDMTMEDLVKLAGEPNNEVSHYDSETSDSYSDTYKYSTESTKYYGGSYYEFRFYNSKLSDITLSWMP